MWLAKNSDNVRSQGAYRREAEGQTGRYVGFQTPARPRKCANLVACPLHAINAGQSPGRGPGNLKWTPRDPASEERHRPPNRWRSGGAPAGIWPYCSFDRRSSRLYWSECSCKRWLSIEMALDGGSPALRRPAIVARALVLGRRLGIALHVIVTSRPSQRTTRDAATQHGSAKNLAFV